MLFLYISFIDFSQSSCSHITLIVWCVRCSMVSSSGPLDVVSPVNFPLKSLLRAPKKMAACSTHLGPIDCWKTATITQKFRVILIGLLAFQSTTCSNVATHNQLINCDDSRPRRHGTSRMQQWWEETIRGVYTEETATTKGKRWDEEWQQTSSCCPCRSYMGSTACSWKSATIIHVVIDKQIDLWRTKTTNKYLLLFLSCLNYAYHLNSDQLHACLYPWDAYLIDFFLLSISLIK